MCQLNGRTFYAAGRVPSRALRAFFGRKAFIYFLEVVAQFVALVLLRDTLPMMVISQSGGVVCASQGIWQGRPGQQLVDPCVACDWSFLLACAFQVGAVRPQHGRLCVSIHVQ